ncbi:MAG: NRDE family protein [Candidatus Solibacter sp.]
MCTVSWLQQPGGYHLLCNRDEKRTRGLAEPPRVMETAGTRYIAPTDSDFRGSWLAVNEYGVALCLLNGEGHNTNASRSRGLIIPELIRARSADACLSLFAQLDLSQFAPFTLLMLEPAMPAALAKWSGARTSILTAVRAPLTSSSYEPDSVRIERLHTFARHQPTDPAGLYRFHTSHAGTSAAHAPCMHRADAATVSFSWIVVTASEVRFLYLPAAPCQSTAGEQQILTRAA